MQFLEAVGKNCDRNPAALMVRLALSSTCLMMLGNQAGQYG